MIGTPVDIGFYTTTGRPISELYLNNGVAWVDEAAVLAGIASGLRYDGLKVRIALVDYEFMADLITLQAVAYANDQTASEVPIVDAGDLYDSTDVEEALAEVMGYAMTLDIAIAALQTAKNNPYQMNLPAGNLTTKMAGATFLPAAWATVAIDGTTNAMITHVLTDRKIVSVNVYEIDGTNERLLKPFETAYSGILANGLTTLIEGIANSLAALRIEFIYD